MKTSSLLPTLALVSGTVAFWRMPCHSQTGVGRLDPIMDPGDIADHVHTIHGGGNFGFNTSFADLTAPGSCTSCGVKEDHSAYWTPSLHFVFDNGTTVMVRQVGGMLAYYQYLLKDVTAFPEGFQMIAGNRNARSFDGQFPDLELSHWPINPTDQGFLEQRALGFNCLNYDKPPEPALYRHKFPSKQQLDTQCKDGLRLELAFPSCGNGDKDSASHQSHVAYPSLVKQGNCPKGFDVHYPLIFFETIWATHDFAGQSGQFALSHGDPTGAGYHGDFIMGWKSQKFLQQALDQCTSQSGNIQDCDIFTLQSDSDAAKCKFEVPSVLKDDDTHGPREGLPVSVPMQYGPSSATRYPCAGRSDAPASPVPHSAPPSSYSAGPDVPYSAAKASTTSTGLGGIIVDKISSVADLLPTVAPGNGHGHDHDREHNKVPQSQATASPSPPKVEPASSPSPSTSPSTSSSSSPPPPPSTSSSPTTSTAEIVPTQPPSPPKAKNKNKIIATSIYTTGGEVVELYIEETDVTVTATATAPAQYDQARHRRHLERHLHHV